MSFLHDIAQRGGSILPWLALDGRVFWSSDADQNDLVTGQTSFAATTPTFMIDVPTGTTLVPLEVRLSQSGTVAGGAVDILLEIDNADRYNTGGTAETILAARTSGAQTAACALYSGATANAGYGVRIHGVTLGQDVSPAEGAQNSFIWRADPYLPDFVVGPGAFLIYTYAGTTGPTWLWSVKWGEVPTGWLS